VPSLQGRLMSTSESWGVNGHTTRCTGLAASAGVRLRAKETDQSRPMGLRTRERTLILLYADDMHTIAI